MIVVIFFDRRLVMFWTMRQVVRCYGFKSYQIYYLIYMGYIEAVKVGRAWRIVPESVKAYIEKKAA